MKKCRTFLLLVFLFCTPALSAQWYVGVKLIGLSIHPKKSPHPQLYKGRIDRNGHLVMNYGIALTCEYRFHPYVAVKFGQAILSDCGGKFAGASMLSLRTQVPLGKLGEGTVGMGPFFYYRRTWKNMDGYVEQGIFKESANKRWQTKFVWHGGELEHNYPINTHMDISTNVLPGIPVVFVVMPGVRWRVSE
jgi:hypothetical protein